MICRPGGLPSLIPEIRLKSLEICRDLSKAYAIELNENINIYKYFYLYIYIYIYTQVNTTNRAGEASGRKFQI